MEEGRLQTPWDQKGRNGYPLRVTEMRQRNLKATEQAVLESPEPVGILIKHVACAKLLRSF